MQLAQYLKNRSQQIEECLDQLIPEKKVPYQILLNAARYSLLGGGKRLRPIFALATFETFGGEVEKALAAAAALEMVHTYSLIHDDLPCMDDDDFRRGKPSLHKAFNEGSAVLAGDFLLTKSFEILANLSFPDAIKVELISALSSHSGDHGMIGGQIMDLAAEGREIDLKHLQLIHQFKTGALIKASILFGAILAEVSSDEKKALEEFGENVGLAFQIVDDILDVTAPQDKHGKKISSDKINQKSTYVTLLGLEHAKILAQESLAKAKDALKKIPRDTGLLFELSNIAVNRQI
jgi:geranylgeranyl diphosphate synthase type II